MYVYNFYSNYKILIIIEFNNLNQTKKAAKQIVNTQEIALFVNFQVISNKMI